MDVLIDTYASRPIVWLYYPLIQGRMRTITESDEQPHDEERFRFMQRHELSEVNEHIRAGDRWKELWHYLGLPSPEKAQATRQHDWWCKSPFHPSETKPSFHMNAKGWSCLSTGRNGTYVNLAAEIWNIDVYHAANRLRRELLGQSAAKLADRTRSFVNQVTDRREEEIQQGNPPIRANLLKSPYFSPAHPEFDRRGISEATLLDLGIGYLDRPPRKSGQPDPLNHRLVFQVRGLEEQEETGELLPVVLTHMGRATTREQEDGPWGKWYMFPGFKKNLELYNLDRVIRDDVAVEQAKRLNHVLIVEGPFDVAKLHEAGIKNVVASLGADLSPAQIRRLDLIDEMIGVNQFLFFYDRDQAGRNGTDKALGAFNQNARLPEELRYPAWVTGLTANLEACAFDWEQTWSSPSRTGVRIPEHITDPCELTVEQLRWLRAEGVI